MIIYKIANKINGKVYIGQTTKCLSERWRQHCKKSSTCNYLHRAIVKYGRENFTVEQIDVACDRDELDVKEVYWIKYYDSMNPKKGYNLRSGGNKNHIISESTKQKISNSKKGSLGYWLGKHLSEATRKKLRDTTNRRPVMCIESFVIYDSSYDAGRKLNIAISHIHDCCKGKRKTCGGYHWGYADE